MGPKIPSPPPAPPPPPPPPPTPTVTDVDNEAHQDAQRAANELKRRRASGSTVLTSGMGLGSPAPTASKTVLGG
jgi:hypothetical protein